MTPFFSIIIPTRDRPETFEKALTSVVEQSYRDLEVIVIDDGSTAEQRKSMDRLQAKYDERVKWYQLDRRPRGHGGSFARNTGAAKSKGAYICMLDDDDQWTDMEYLSRVHKVIADSDIQVDLHFANQEAYRGDDIVSAAMWIQGLTEIITKQNRSPDANGAFDVDVADLLRAGGFCHLNTLVVRRELFDMVGGLDENLRYEEDRDLFLRVIDVAKTIKYSPAVVSRHNVPDPARQDNVSTMVSNIDKHLFQLHLLAKASLLANDPAIRAYGRRHRAYTLKKIAEELVEAGRARDALNYALQGLGAKPTLKWTAYSLLIALRAVMQRGRKNA
ncbi:MAG: glycosyltransferase [Gammaproteobacteria bacterium]|nr:glycosyltransferase [Gammaproteobacteria bacterium]MDH3767662.1 glycosyltransferase [Gammaproteobacteria bacterium]